MNTPKLPADRQVSRDGGQLTDQFWLFFDALARWIRANLMPTLYGTNAARLLLVLGALADGIAYAETDTGLIYQARAGVWTFVAGTQVVDQTLVAASTTINIPTTGVVDLVEIVRQDATGGRAIVWGTGFKATAVNIDTTASTISTFRFVLSGGFYVQVGQPTTGMTP